jgi:tetratricopeptide (TPR) repeat protein
MADDDLDFDLSAWEAPAPPAGIADGVVERMREAVAASPMTHLIQTVPSRRRWWIAGGAVGLAAAAALAILLLGGKRPDESGHGSIVAKRAQHLELGGVTGDLDPGVELTWDRDGNGLRVVQRRGSVMWKVDGDDHLVIDAGAAVASVEASGASLRVEVHMNQSDARLIGVSGVTAAAVALVTVVVYEGHIKSTSGGQTTIVAAGDTWKSPGQEQPTVGVNTPAPTPTPAPAPAVSADLKLACLAAKADKKWQDLMDCAKRLEPADPTTAREYAAVAVSETRSELAIARLKEAVAQHDAAFAKSEAKKIPDDSVYKEEAKLLVAAASCDVEALRTVGTELVNMGRYSEALGAFNRAMACGGNNLAIVRLAFLAACQAGDAVRASELFGQIPPAQQNGVQQICLRNHIDPTKVVATAGSCNADKLRDDGIAFDDHEDYTHALDAFEASIKCKHDDGVVLRAYFAACNGKNADKAREHFADLSSWDQAIVAPYCGPVTTLTPSSTNVDTCMPPTLVALGSEYIRHGQYTAALAPLKKSLTCKGGDTVQTVKLAFLAACQSGDAGSARTLFAKIPSSQRAGIAQICLRNHIDPNVPAKKDPAPPKNAIDVDASSTIPPPAKCDVDELRTKGTEFVNMGQYGAGLTKFKEAMKCPGGNNLAIVRLAFLAACMAGDQPSAKQLFALIPPPQQNGIWQICNRNHIDPTK